MEGGVAFLCETQWQAGMTDPAGDLVDEDHPYFGGAGYGRHGRPDVSNTQIMVQALHDAGLSPTDPAFQRAATFIARCQGTKANDFFPPGTIVPDGGIVYSTSEDAGNIGVPQSMANPGQQDPSVDEGDRRPVSGLRGYGSMTYAGFKSFLYAGLTREDPRVAAALGWIRSNHALDRNPGMPDGLDQQGLYYFYLVYGQALNAYGEPTLTLADGESLDWRNALAAVLAERQRPDGSWSNEADRLDGGRPEPCHRLRRARPPGGFRERAQQNALRLAGEASGRRSWAILDSNQGSHRQLIYSQPRLAAPAITLGRRE